MSSLSIAPSELIINPDGSIFHLHILPEDLADIVILVGDPGRVKLVASFFEEGSIRVDKSSREFRTITGRYNGREISVISTGIGTDNIDIVATELDALVNIDFNTRCVRADHKRLTLLRIGTCGAVQPATPLGSYLFSEYSIGFDGLLNWYAGCSKVVDAAMESAFVRHMNWPERLPAPYFIKSSERLISLFEKNSVMGMTISAPGFYGPQGRSVRLPLTFDDLIGNLESFRYDGRRVTNIEMESSALAGLSALLGHDAGTICLVIANRYAKESRPDYHLLMKGLVRLALDTLTGTSI
ncbi:MAG: nucleoside phosphorylase [Bacteroidales bacterium]|jgi:uridine phosphorylase|nr:nucleoside phosphorylase [Bacteroidales bacterium]